MQLNHLDYSRERAVMRLADDPTVRQEASRAVQGHWDDLLLMAEKYCVSESCVFDLVEYLYGMRFFRWGDRVAKKPI